MLLKRNDSIGLYQHFEYEYEKSNQLQKLWRKNTELVEVWPGDTNNDGKVEVDDQHPAGYNYKLKAKARDTRSTAWKAYLAIQRKGDDLVFSDTNGDGKINELDTIAIHRNLLKTHIVAEPTATKPFSYQYDKNGNMVYDEYKKLHISYNILNLPDTLSVTGQGKIVNQYLADGTLLRRSFFDEDDNEVKRIDYQGEFLFVNGKLDKVFTEEGYYQPTAATKTKKSDFGTYYYALKDHLGHTRVVVDEEENVIQETAYYPYGGIIAGLSTKTKYDYLYTGKEFIDSLGVNWYDHHARYYDPEIGRWFAIDPALQAASPYVAMGNNPMMNIDENGEFFFTALSAVFAPPLLPLAIGADIGMWGGGTMVNGTGNPFKWDFSDGKTWTGMGVGAIAGGLGGGISSGMTGLTGLEAAVIGGMTTGAINGGGMTALYGGNFNNIMGGMIKGSVIGGVTAAVGYGAFQGIDRLTTYAIDDITYHLPMHNVISYAGSSVASKVTGNIMTGQKTFNNLDKALRNPGIVLPATIDFLGIAIPLALNTKIGNKLVSKIAKNIANKNLPKDLNIQELSIKDLRMFQIEVGMLTKIILEYKLNIS